MARPSIKTPCVADRYSQKVERTAEFSSRFGGGLINVRENTSGKERTLVSVHRCDPMVEVVVGVDDSGKQTPVFIGGKRVPDMGKLLGLLDSLWDDNGGSAIVTDGGAIHSAALSGQPATHVLIPWDVWHDLAKIRTAIRGEG